MEVAIFVASCDPLQTVVSHEAHFLFCRRAHVFGDNFVEVLLHELEDKVEAVLLADNFF